MFPVVVADILGLWRFAVLIRYFVKDYEASMIGVRGNWVVGCLGTVTCED